MEFLLIHTSCIEMSSSNKQKQMFREELIVLTYVDIKLLYATFSSTVLALYMPRRRRRRLY